MPVKEPIKVDFGADANTALEKYVHMQLEGLIRQTDKLFTEKYVEWQKIYKGVPKEASKSFPWKNASNLVVQVVGMHVDTLRANVLGNIIEIMPLYITQLVGDWPVEEDADGQQAAIEEFMNLMGLEPSELDLYRVLSSGFGDCIKHGAVFWKLPWETQLEKRVIGYADGKIVTEALTKYDGPRPEKLGFTNCLITPSANTVEQAEFIAHKISLKRYQLEERKQLGMYDDAALTSILNSPDRTGKAPAEKQVETQQGVQGPGLYDLEAEWDIYECHFSYFHNKDKYRIIYTYHYGTKKTLRAIFNFYPDNDVPFESARLGYDGEDGIYGYGFCEMLRHYQEEISTTHNQRMDSNTLANTNVFRVGRDSKLDAIFKLYPGALVPAEEGEFEPLQLGRSPQESVAYENLTLSLAQQRSGIEPGISAAGAGGPGGKGQPYSAMGTFSVMQQGNRRQNINTTDMRYAHIKLGRKFLRQYSNFGIGSRAQLFGAKSGLLLKALKNYQEGKMMLPIKAATASINRELEKQNLMLLTNVMKEHYTGVAQIMQSLQNPAVPEPVKEYLTGVIQGSSRLMDKILRNFGEDDTSRYLPEGKILKEQQNAARTVGAGRTSSSAGSPRPDAVESPNNETQGADSSTIPGAGMGVPTGVSQ